jgi:DNA-binding NarL/FixJ family response regulator
MAPTELSPTVAICDPSEIGRLGIGTALRGQGLRVVGTAATLETSLALAKSGKADVVLVDLQLAPAPHAATEVIQAVEERGATPIAIAAGTEPEAVFDALRAGAAGYLTKDMPARAWGDAITAAVRGEAALSRSMTALLVNEFRNQARTAPMSRFLPSDRRLTRREWEILGLLAAGHTNRSVAEELFISVETVRTHVSNILAKLDAPNRSAAAAKYREMLAASETELARSS